MRTLILDHNEFVKDSEESLVISSGSTNGFENIREFCNATEKLKFFEGASPIKYAGAETKVIGQLQYGARLIQFMISLCSIAVRSDQVIYVLDDSWNSNDYVFEIERRYYRYYWSTSA